MSDDAVAAGSLERAPDFAARLDELTLQELREVVRYAQQQMRERQGKREHQQRQEQHEPSERQESVSGRITAAPGEEILSVTERSEYTEIIKREPCGEHCSNCPHGPYLYHVYEETHPDGESSLHWVFLGHVSESLRTTER
ncbi:hypothetical protein G3I44_09250 [Halogeometricum borinquense]|uniref:Uncharacterized protein n=1 Tax=Halogeometricum borinquense TaxID=60847 RepID=A0A6C0UJH8_9EURY|nr:hypothetical protein [Halogeometricum borinquense]QIB74451.1 hypothetical protein G3I44_09250 [Halogeometricum borinquense]